MKKRIRLTEGDLNSIVKNSVNRILRESDGLDADEYFDEHYKGESGSFSDSISPYAKMPEGYDDDVDIDTADRISMLNNNNEAEVYPYLKGIENNASWDAFDADRRYRMGDEYDDVYDAPAYKDFETNGRYSLGDFENPNMFESKIGKIVRESIKRTLKEGQMGSVVDNLQQANALLSDVMNSGFIPFTSPAPSSTEKELKDAIIEAARMIDKASYLCGQLGYA